MTDFHYSNYANHNMVWKKNCFKPENLKLQKSFTEYKITSLTFSYKFIKTIFCS